MYDDVLEYGALPHSRQEAGYWRDYVRDRERWFEK